MDPTVAPEPKSEASPGQQPSGTASATPGSSSRPNVGAQVDRALGPREGNFDTRNKGGRPPDIQGRIADLERLTGKKVIVRGPDDPPEAIAVGKMTITPEEFEGLKLDLQDSLSDGIVTASDLAAEQTGKEKLRTPKKQADALGKLWNMTLVRKMPAAWLSAGVVAIAAVVTVIWAIPKALILVQYFIEKRRTAKKAA